MFFFNLDAVVVGGGALLLRGGMGGLGGLGNCVSKIKSSSGTN